ncbi:MAG: TlpA family protein disulfide reductase [Flavobacteriales bacterium]|nr:TlpA family protein disulfide reductase [Flavobacteriales bacterium]MBP6696904.1 TlpA family protein disulfide reductase [Flavobacteriales bacterium]
MLHPFFVRALLFAPAAFLLGCGAPSGKPLGPREGPWHLSLDLNGEELPFLFDLERDSAGWRMVVHNGEEHIVVDDLLMYKDSVRVRMPLFDSEFRGALLNDSTITGQWHNYLKGPDYRIGFVARAGRTPRFGPSVASNAELSGQWEAHFSPGTADAYDALGIFQQKDGRVTGTFGTETGDYRFLEGVVDGDSLKLSCFDGSHAFLFKALLRNDSLLGRYWSGTHWQEPWVAVRNPAFHLRDPDSLTFLKEGYDMVDFSFPSIDGGAVSPKDARHAGHVMMVQVMGSWCPNCVDETLLLDEMYAKYHDAGLDVIAIAFEKYEDEPRAIAALRRFRDQLEVKYDILYAGSANKEIAGAKLPFLDHVMSYPTCIFIDRAGKVRRIRTGFYGPGTGEHYAHYKRNLDAFLQHLLNEPVATPVTQVGG